MNTVLHPVGAQPARVYWVRRLALLAVVVLVVVLAFAAVSAARGAADDDTGGSDGPAGTAQEGADDAADPADDGERDDDAEASPGEVSPAGEDDADGDGAEGGAGASEPSTGAPPACSPEQITLTLTTDDQAYGPEGAPTFTLAFTNTGETACVIDAGSAQRTVVVSSGDDRVWSSADCVTEGGQRTLLLAPGAQDEDTVVWSRVRSDEACTADLPAPRPGTYTAIAVLAGAQSGTAVFQLG